jgi:enterochelin esterase-like enzyme
LADVRWPILDNGYTTTTPAIVCTSEFLIFGAMQLLNVPGILLENRTVLSRYLDREVLVDFYLPANVADPSAMSLLILNDGQNMEEMGFQEILAGLYTGGQIRPLLCAAVHAGTERKMEYGIASTPDYLGRGAKAGDYTSFILEELLPIIHTTYAVPSFAEKAIAGFSLGGLTALDIAWNHSTEFSKAGIFSGSLWWRSVDQDEKGYDDNLHRIMHQEIRKGIYHPGLRFFFQSGNMDETNDRNNNGIIDSIDDTLDLMKELVAKGYDQEKDIHYLEMPEGKHDIPTWGKAMPEFLKWGWGVKGS